MGNAFEQDIHRKNQDKYARAYTVITEPHRMAHDGLMYHASGKITGLVDTGTQDLLIVTAAGNFPHLQRMGFDFGAGDVDILAYEDTTTSADGTEATAYNTNRNSSNTPDMTLYTGPTVTGVGTLLHTNWAPPTSTGVGQTPAGFSDVTQGEEWILKPNTKHLVRITNNSGATIALRFELLWYEIDYSTV